MEIIEALEEVIVVEVVDVPEIVVEIGEGSVPPVWGMIGGDIGDQADLMELAEMLGDAINEKADADDVYSKGEVDSALSDKADVDDMADAFDLVDTALSQKADADDVYSKDEMDSALAGYLPLHGTADQSGGVVPVVLTNEDLNDLRPGVTTWYYCQNSANIGNRPPSNPGSFGLVVYRLAGLGRYQVLTTAGGLIYSRVYRSGGVGWSAWVEWNVSYELPAASGSVLGGVKVGRNLSIGNGVLSADASGIVCEVSGDPAVFGDGGDDVPVRALSVGIEPVQAGSGDPSPSNVRPISGWTGAGLSVNGASVPITFPSAAGTVYGGTLDAVNGVLTVTHRCAVIGDLSWTYDAQYSRFQTIVNGIFARHGARTIKFTASCFVSIDDERGVLSIPENAIYCGSYSENVYIKTSAFPSAEDFVSAFSGEKFVYPLASPVTYQLTPVEVRTLLGQNVMGSDCGPVSVRYGADTKLYIDGKFAALQALVLES